MRTLTFDTNMLLSVPKNEVGSDQINALLKGRTFSDKKDEFQVDMNPPIPEYDPKDMEELETYCRSRGIVGVNFQGRSPKAILSMLKGMRGESQTSQTKKGLLNG
jgi:hypothetical protein